MRILILALSLVAAAPQEAPSPSAQKHPEPAADEIKEAQKDIRDLFKKEYAQTSKAARQSLAAQFLQFGRSGGEKPVARYVVLKEAIDLSLQADDAPTALAAADEIIKRTSP